MVHPSPPLMFVTAKLHRAALVRDSVLTADLLWEVSPSVCERNSCSNMKATLAWPASLNITVIVNCRLQVYFTGFSKKNVSINCSRITATFIHSSHIF